MRGRTILSAMGGEIRLARQRAGLSLELVGRAAVISAAEVSRIERARAEWVSVLTLARLCAVLGLDFAAKAYPGGNPIRDAHHNRLLTRFRERLHPSLGWAVEVPLPNPGDQRAWDAMIRGEGWRYGVECELNPIDGQAILRRLALKQKEGMVDGLILLLTDTRQARLFRREFAEALRAAFPAGGTVALVRLGSGKDPGGSAMITL
ncbi:MAG: helix-turn-helix transcriptional regulator [Chloroflexota bacterium]